MKKVKEMKKLIFIFFLLINFAYAEEINLLCDITYKEDNLSPQRIKTRVEVSFYNDRYVAIIPDSNLLYAVSTQKNTKTISVINLSNASKWHVNEVTGYKTNSGISDTTIIIDRNSGTISYNQIYKSSGGQILSSGGFGNCEKINPNIKKF